MRTSIAIGLAGTMWAGMAAFAGVAWAEGAASATATGLEAPSSTKSVKLPNDGSITCAYYPDVTVRALVLDSESNPVVSFIKAANAPCKPGKVAGAVGYDATLGLIGRKGSLYVFADATGIDVYDFATRKRIHRGEVARAADGLSPADPKGMVVSADAAGLGIGYRHEVYETCSILKDKACWGKLAKLARLTGDLAKQAPNCAAAYKAANAQPDFTSAIGFRRDVTIAPDGKVSVKVSGPVSCRSL
jgi:hypothetical protein